MQPSESPSSRSLHRAPARRQPATVARLRHTRPIPTIAAMVTAPISAFIGRDDELRRTVAELESGRRLITLVGAAGFGKTRLAQEAVRGMKNRRVVWADLRPDSVRDSDDVVSEICRALAVTLPPGPGPAGERLLSVLPSLGPTLLVCDNAETAHQHLAQWAGAWLSTAQKLQILATSRQRLGVDGELCVAVGPLTLPASDFTSAGGAPNAAVALLYERASTLGATIDLSDPDTRDAMTRLAARLDANPLALELAAPRLAYLQPNDLLARMDHRFAILRPADEGVGRSLWDAIAASWSRATDAEQVALKQLALFRGGLTVDVAEVVLTEALPDDFALDLVDALIRKSLIRAPSASNDRRLTFFESIRTFVEAQHLEDPEGTATARQRRDGWLVTASPVPIQTALGAIQDAIDSENAAGAMDGPAAARLLLRIRQEQRWMGVPLPGQKVLVEAVLALEEIDARDTLALETLLLVICAKLGLGPEARATYDRCVSRAEALGDPALLGAALTQARLLEKLEPAEFLIETVTRGIALLDEAGERVKAMQARAGFGTILLRTGRFAEAESMLMSARQAAVDGLLSDGDRAQALNNLASIYGSVGRWADATPLFEEAHAAAERSGRELLATVITSNLGECALVARELDAARRYFLECVEGSKRVGYPRGIVLGTGHLASLDHFEGNLEDARDGYNQALTILAEQPDPVATAMLSALSALCAAESDDQEGADRLLGDSRAALLKVNDPVLESAVDIVTLAIAVTAGHGPEEAFAASTARVEALVKSNMQKWEEEPNTTNRLHLVKFAESFFLRAMEKDAKADALAQASWWVHPEGRAFEAPNGERVELGRKAKARRVLSLLAAERLREPGKGVDVDEVFEAGWPGENIGEPHRTSRIYVVISELRKLGLGDLLEHDGDGYRLDPRIPLRVDGAP